MVSQLGIGIVGTGRISDLHAAEYLANPGSRIVALCDQNPQLAEGRAAAWGCKDVSITSDMDELFANRNVDVVELLLPHHLHLDAAVRAMNAGKIVSLQKPMCRNLQEADALVAASQDAAHPVKIFENFVFHPPVMRAVELIENNEIGDLVSIRLKSNPGRSRTAWQVPKEANAWRQTSDLAGGGPLVFDDGHHKFALARHFMGEPLAVHAFIGECETAEGIFFDAPSMISFTFAGNRVGNLEIAYSPELDIDTNYYAQDDRIEITGTSGVIYINCGHGRLGSVPPLALYAKGEYRVFNDISTDWAESFKLSTRHFLSAIESGARPVLEPEEAREVLAFAIAAETSARLKRSVAVDSVGRQEQDES